VFFNDVCGVGGEAAGALSHNERVYGDVAKAYVAEPSAVPNAREPIYRETHDGKKPIPKHEHCQLVVQEQQPERSVDGDGHKRCSLVEAH